MIDAYFKSYFWTFRLLVLTAAAFLVGRTINTFVGAALAPAPDSVGASPPPAARVAASAAGAATPVTAILDRNVFRAMREKVETPVEGPAPVAVAVQPWNANNCSKAVMQAALVATIVARDPQSSIAVFSDQAKSEAVTHRKGEKLLGEAEIMEIGWRRVLVNHNNRCELFSLEEEEVPVAATAPPMPHPTDGDPGNPGDDLGKTVQKTGANDYRIARGDVDNVLAHLNELGTQARIMPNFENGRPNGFKLLNVRPDSFYAKIGIQSNDVIQRINGHEMSAPDKALEAYQRLKDAQTITIDVSRNGKQTTLTYQIQ